MLFRKFCIQTAKKYCFLITENRLEQIEKFLIRLRGSFSTFFFQKQKWIHCKQHFCNNFCLFFYITIHALQVRKTCDYAAYRVSIKSYSYHPVTSCTISDWSCNQLSESRCSISCSKGNVFLLSYYTGWFICYMFHIETSKFAAKLIVHFWI